MCSHAWSIATSRGSVPPTVRVLYELKDMPHKLHSCVNLVIKFLYGALLWLWKLERHRTKQGLSNCTITSQDFKNQIWQVFSRLPNTDIQYISTNMYANPVIGNTVTQGKTKYVTRGIHQTWVFPDICTSYTVYHNLVCPWAKYYRDPQVKVGIVLEWGISRDFVQIQKRNIMYENCWNLKASNPVRTHSNHLEPVSQHSPDFQQIRQI